MQQPLAHLYFLAVLESLQIQSKKSSVTHDHLVRVANEINKVFHIEYTDIMCCTVFLNLSPYTLLI